MRVASFEHPKQVARPFQPFGAMALSVAILTALVPLARAADFTDQLTRAQGYEYGEGLPKDQLVAAAMYCDAARAGSAEAAFRLGWMYANGRGVAHDDATAAAISSVCKRHRNNPSIFHTDTVVLTAGIPSKFVNIAVRQYLKAP